MTQYLESSRPANLRHHRDRQALLRREHGRVLWPAAAHLAAELPAGGSPAATPISSQLWAQLCAIESEAELLDRTLRRTWYLVGGLILPCAGFLVYSLALVR